MKLKNYFLIAIMLFALSAFSAETDLREFIADVEEVKQACEAARIVQFEEAKLAPHFSRKGDDFLFKAIKVYSKVTFRSKKLASLCERMGGGDEFSALVGRSVVFGLPKGKSELEGRLFLGTVCKDDRCSDEEYVLILAE